MSELIKINNKEISVKEYSSQRVVTFREIDELHERPEGTASRTFSQNKGRFILNRDYFHLTPDEMLSTKIVNYSSPKGLNLITESGYLMLVKSLTDDLSWTVQRQLVDTYFKVKKDPMLETMMKDPIMALRYQQIQMEHKVTALDNKVNNALDVFTTPAKDDWRQETNDKVNQMCLEQGLSYQGFRHDIYTELENTARVDLSIRQLRLRNRMKKEGATVTECKAISKLDIVERDPKLKPIFEGIVRRYQAKYAVSKGSITKEEKA
jgi:hypothetical protein